MDSSVSGWCTVARVYEDSLGREFMVGGTMRGG